MRLSGDIKQIQFAYKSQDGLRNMMQQMNIDWRGLLRGPRTLTIQVFETSVGCAFRWQLKSRHFFW